MTSMVSKTAPDWGKGHRNRLRGKFLDGKLADYELFEMLLGYALPRIDVRPIARGLLKSYGNIHKIMAAPYKELCVFPGLGKNSAAFLKAVCELTLLDYKHCLSDNPLFFDRKRLEDYCRLALLGKKQEEFHVLYLDSDRRLITDDVHARGTVGNVSVYPREILRRALESNARFVVLLHNHPDGKESFSKCDMELTMMIKDKLGIDGIEVIDHLLLAGDALHSAKNLFLYQ